MRVHFVKLQSVDLGSLEDLDFADGDVLEGIDEFASLVDLFAVGVGGKVGDQTVDGAVTNFLVEDFDDLLADGLDLGSLSVSGLLAVLGDALGEGDGEDTDDVAIGGLNVTVGLDQALPLADELAQLVSGHVHTEEGGLGSVSLNLVDNESDLSPGKLI